MIDLTKLIYLCATCLFLTISSFAAENGVIVARVNNKVITKTDLEQRYLFALSFSKIKINSTDEKTLLLNQIIDKMIDEELILQEGGNMKIEITQSAIDDATESLALRQKKTVSSFKNFFIERKIPVKILERQIEADLIWSKIITNSVRSKIKIGDSEVKEFLEPRVDVGITKFLIAEIFIPNEDNAKLFATKLVTELRNGANFNVIVKQFSRSHSAENNGEIGFVSKLDIDKKIYEAISNLEKNQYSDPVFLGSGYYIFKMLDKKIITEIKESDFLEAQKQIFSRELEIESKSYMMELRKKSFIEVNREIL